MSQGRILIVEDDAVIALRMSGMLEGWGYEIATCPSGEEAVAAVTAHAPEVVLMDVHLAGAMDGTEAARRIAERFDLPIIFLTAHADEELVKRAARSEPYGYLLKPVQAGELRAALTIAFANHALRAALRVSERRFRTLFEHNAVPMWEMDIAPARAFLAQLRRAGVVDFADHLRHRPEELRAFLALLRIEDANRASLRFFGVDGLQELREAVPRSFTGNFLTVMSELLAAVEQGAGHFERQTAVLAHGEERVILLRAALAPGEQPWLIVSFVDISERTRHEELLRQIAIGVSSNIGQNYFTAVAAFLNRRPGINAAFLAEIGGTPPMARTLALSVGNALQPNRTVRVAGGPCEALVNSRETCLFPDRARELFPHDDLLRDFGAGAFLGEPVCNSSGTLIGALCVAGAALADLANLESILKIFAVRAAGEMERIGTLFSLKSELAACRAAAAFAREIVDPQATIETVAAALLARAKDVTRSRHGYVATVDTGTGDCVIHTFTDMLEGDCNLPRDQRKVIFPPGPDGRYFALWGHALNTRAPFFTNQPQTHPDSLGTPEGHLPVECFLSIPVIYREKLLGQVALANTPGGYRERDLAAIAPLADLYARYLWRRNGEAVALSGQAVR